MHTPPQPHRNHSSHSRHHNHMHTHTASTTLQPHCSDTTALQPHCNHATYVGTRANTRACLRCFLFSALTHMHTGQPACSRRTHASASCLTTHNFHHGSLRGFLASMGYIRGNGSTTRHSGLAVDGLRRSRSKVMRRLRRHHLRPRLLTSSHPLLTPHFLPSSHTTSLCSLSLRSQLARLLARLRIATTLVAELIQLWRHRHTASADAAPLDDATTTALPNCWHPAQFGSPDADPQDADADDGAGAGGGTDGGADGDASGGGGGGGGGVPKVSTTSPRAGACAISCHPVSCHPISCHLMPSHLMPSHLIPCSGQPSLTPLIHTSPRAARRSLHEEIFYWLGHNYLHRMGTDLASLPLPVRPPPTPNPNPNPNPPTSPPSRSPYALHRPRPRPRTDLAHLPPPVHHHLHL
jgi:hypothetical protein